MFCNYKDILPWDFPKTKEYISLNPQVTIRDEEMYTIQSSQKGLLDAYNKGSFSRTKQSLIELCTAIKQFLPLTEPIILPDAVNICLCYLRRNQSPSTSIGDMDPVFINNVSRLIFYLSESSSIYFQYFAVPEFKDILINHIKNSNHFSLLIDLFSISINILQNPQFSTIFQSFDFSVLPPLLQKINEFGEKCLYDPNYLIELQKCICEFLRLMTFHPLNAFSWKCCYDSILIISNTIQFTPVTARIFSYILLNLVINEGGKSEKVSISENKTVYFSEYQHQCFINPQILTFVKDNCFEFRDILLFVYIKLVFLIKEVPENLNIGTIIDVYFQMIHSGLEYTDKDECFFIYAVHNLINFDKRLCDEPLVHNFVAFIFNERTENYGFLAKRQSAHFIATFAYLKPEIFFGFIQPPQFVLFLENILFHFDSDGFESVNDKLCLIDILKAVSQMYHYLSNHFPDQVHNLEGCEAVGILKCLASQIVTSTNETQNEEYIAVAKIFLDEFPMSKE